MLTGVMDNRGAGRYSLGVLIVRLIISVDFAQPGMKSKLIGR